MPHPELRDTAALEALLLIERRRVIRRAFVQRWRVRMYMSVGGFVCMYVGAVLDAGLLVGGGFGALFASVPHAIVLARRIDELP